MTKSIELKNPELKPCPMCDHVLTFEDLWINDVWGNPAAVDMDGRPISFREGNFCKRFVPDDDDDTAGIADEFVLSCPGDYCGFRFCRGAWYKDLSNELEWKKDFAHWANLRPGDPRPERTKEDKEKLARIVNGVLIAAIAEPVFKALDEALDALGEEDDCSEGMDSTDAPVIGRAGDD